MMKAKLCIMAAVFCGIVLLFSSCDNLQNLLSPPPCSISGFEIKKGAVNTVCRVASASFCFINTSSKEINAFTLIFRLYDGDKKPIGTSSNIVILEYSGIIAPDDEKEIVISLDRFIPQETGSQILADQIYVESVLFSDGEAWSDYFGVWQL
jgi:hypothetical protein